MVVINSVRNRRGRQREIKEYCWVWGGIEELGEGKGEYGKVTKWRTQQDRKRIPKERR